MTVDQCPTCHAMRPAGANACRRCGYAFASPPLSEDRGPVLVLRERGGTTGGQSWQVVGEANISRNDPDAEIALPDRSVSRRHARIRLVGTHFMIEDQGSKNGTFVNGHQVSAPRPIRGGDQLAFGDVVLVAEIQRPAGNGSADQAAAKQANADAGRTVLFGGEASPVRDREDGTLIEPRRSVLDPLTGPARVLRAAEVSVVPAQTVPGPVPVAPTRAAPAPVVAVAATTAAAATVAVASADPVVVPPVSPAPISALPATGGQRLLTAWTLFQGDLAGSLGRFERSGGRQTLHAVIERLKRLESSPPTGRELDALVDWLPTVRTLLESELELIDLVAPLSSAGDGARSRDEVQTHPGRLDRVTGMH